MHGSSFVSYLKLSVDNDCNNDPCVGDKMHNKSTGIVVRNSSLSGASILTSSALVSTSDTERWSTPALEVCSANFSVLDALT